MCKDILRMRPTMSPPLLPSTSAAYVRRALISEGVSARLSSSGSSSAGCSSCVCLGAACLIGDDLRCLFFVRLALVSSSSVGCSSCACLGAARLIGGDLRCLLVGSTGSSIHPNASVVSRLGALWFFWFACTNGGFTVKQGRVSGHRVGTVVVTGEGRRRVSG